MATYYQPKQRTEWFIDGDGVPTICQHRDAVKPHTVDWADALDASETISSSTWTANGVTTSSPGNTTTTTTVTVSGTDGSLTNTVVTSASRTLVRVLRFIGVAEGTSTMDQYFPT